MQVPPPPARPMRHRRRPGPYTRARAALAHRRFRRRRRQRAAGRAIGLRISNLALEQATRTRCGDGQGGRRAGGALEVEKTGDDGRQRRVDAFERPRFARPPPRRGLPRTPRRTFRVCSWARRLPRSPMLRRRAGRRVGTGGRLLADPPNRARPPITQLASGSGCPTRRPSRRPLRASPPRAVRRPMSTSATSTDAEGLVLGTYVPPSG
jgi:hypothetical protein